MRDMALMERQFAPVCRISPSESSEIVNNDQKFAINLNVSQFKPEDLKINLDGRTLSIQGEQELKTDHGYSKKSFSRVILLPEDVDVGAVASNLSEDGKLSIEAPKKEAVQGRSIPIQQAIVEEKSAE
ncbi:SHSP domain-containing protein [Caenorhabditis elegans]|nr:SHSP domain-containing protein [Caenorhabditis elegans]CDK13498.1 SHSP domain-containing protein [Caenorhabditis elegans]|eukprot:NP_001294665.1 Heat shock protein Hsp-16.2 [Caenorhabditis elegans]